MNNENKKKYQDTFIKSLSIDGKKFNEKIKYNEISEWDSIGHMTLMSELEGAFNITIDTDDIVDFSSFNKGFEILEKYGVKF
jgi:acyl carrier protein|tara:strand:- start:26 stop:271 length:246 start_codon:yes stop_codon:yes gene_type:complete